MSTAQRWVDPKVITAWREFISNYPAELAVSLSYNYQRINTGIVRSNVVHGHLDRYHRDIDIDLLGSHCHKWLASDRSEFVGFVENEKTNTHIHLCWRLPPSVDASSFLKRAEIVWKKKIAGSGSVCVKPIRDSGWAEYITDNIVSIVETKPELFVASRLLKTSR